jgi:hypothetical protein
MQELNDRLHTSFIVVPHDLDLAGRMQRQLKLVVGILQAASSKTVKHDHLKPYIALKVLAKK